MNVEEFRHLPTTQVARLVREAGPKVCVFPINGTRRWFMLEHQPRPEENSLLTYLDVTGRRHIELYRMLFDHGVDTLLTPVFGPDLLERGENYLRLAAAGLSRLATHRDFLDFYAAYNVRVRFYGDYHQFFDPTPYAYLADLFDRLAVQTAVHNQYRLFFGVCAQDATETVARLAVRYHAEHGRIPDKRTLVELYYGEYVGPVDFFIGFDKFCVFDMPLIATGNEDLYFTVSPSPYLTEQQLRDILYDHLYARRGKEPDYLHMDSQAWALMKEFYQANMGQTLGVGARQNAGEFWYPLPQVVLPTSWM